MTEATRTTAPPSLPARTAAALSPDEAARLRVEAETRWVARAADPGGLPCLRPEVVAARGWVLAPLEDELVEERADRLAAACASHGLARAWAVELPHADSRPAAYRGVPLAGGGLTALRHDVMIGSGYLLVEEGREAFAVVSDGDMYWLLAGPAPFVEEASGAPLAETLARFGALVARYTRRSTTGTGLALSRIHAIAVALLADAAGPDAPPSHAPGR